MPSALQELKTMMKKTQTPIRRETRADGLLGATAAVAWEWIQHQRSALAFGGLILCLGGLNAWGAHATFAGAVGIAMAVVAMLSEYLGATLAMDAERAATGEHKRWDRAVVCGLLVAVVFAPLNVWGTHRAYEAAVLPSLEKVRMEAQAKIDAERNVMRDELARLDRRIDERQAILDAIPTDIYGSRMEIAQRPQLELLAQLNAERSGVQKRMDAQILVAERPAPPLPDWLIWLGGIMLEVAKVIGLWAVGAGASAARRGDTFTGNAGQALARQRWIKAEAKAMRERERAGYLPA
jgi:hypothetical protein